MTRLAEPAPPAQRAGLQTGQTDRQTLLFSPSVSSDLRLRLSERPKSLKAVEWKLLSFL